jgi:putative ABC transport system permease protein
MNFLVELREGLAISWSAIRANKLRSVLTTLGIIIGIVTVTLMAAAIEGMNRSFMNSISSIGADVLYVDQRGWFIRSHQEWIDAMKNPQITLAETESVEEQLNHVMAVAPVASDDGPVKYRNKSSSSVPMIGTTEKYFLTAGLTMGEGRFFSAAESMGGRPVCVIGSDLATNLFGGESPVGKSISANRHDLEVVGVLDKQGGTGDSSGTDTAIIMPVAQFLRTVWSNPPYTIQIKVGSPDQLGDAKEEVRTVMRRIRHIAPGKPDNFAINEQDQFVELFHQIGGTIEAVGLFITGLSLFVGGIGIMNIMFVSVAERTREIGVRKAIGAKRRAILVQFLSEAACICLIGGIIGLMIAWPTTLLLQKAMPAAMSPFIVCLALLISALTGVLSGFLPAWRAARMNPVDALRNE